MYYKIYFLDTVWNPTETGTFYSRNYTQSFVKIRWSSKMSAVPKLELHSKTHLAIALVQDIYHLLFNTYYLAK